MILIRGLLTIEEDDGSIRRMWEGPNDITIDGVVYEGTQDPTGTVLKIGSYGDSENTTVLMILDDESARRYHTQDVGHPKVIVERVRSDDSGITWVKTPISNEGKYSNPQLDYNNVLTFEVAPPEQEQDQVSERFKSHEEQQRMYPHDMFFKDLAMPKTTKQPP